MDFAIEILLMGETRFLTFVFLLTGVMIYMVDYKKFSRANGRERESKFCKRIAQLYIGGGACLLVALQVLGWFI